jgi:small-conductance mechanosensitive channel
MDRLNYLLSEYLRTKQVVYISVLGGITVTGRVQSLGFEFVKIEKPDGSVYIIPVDKIAMIRVIK